jgi:hypothetical protein
LIKLLEIRGSHLLSDFPARRSRHPASALYALDGDRRVSLQTFLFFAAHAPRHQKRPPGFRAVFVWSAVMCHQRVGRT